MYKKKQGGTQPRINNAYIPDIGVPQVLIGRYQNKFYFSVAQVTKPAKMMSIWN